MRSLPTHQSAPALSRRLIDSFNAAFSRITTCENSFTQTAHIPFIGLQRYQFGALSLCFALIASPMPSFAADEAKHNWEFHLAEGFALEVGLVRPIGVLSKNEVEDFKRSHESLRLGILSGKLVQLFYRETKTLLLLALAPMEGYKFELLLVAPIGSVFVTHTIIYKDDIFDSEETTWD